VLFSAAGSGVEFARRGRKHKGVDTDALVLVPLPLLAFLALLSFVLEPFLFSSRELVVADFPLDFDFVGFTVGAAGVAVVVVWRGPLDTSCRKEKPPGPGGVPGEKVVCAAGGGDDKGGDDDGDDDDADDDDGVVPATAAASFAAKIADADFAGGADEEADLDDVEADGDDDVEKEGDDDAEGDGDDDDDHDDDDDDDVDDDDDDDDDDGR
jgi:hypothetical protein